MSRDSIAQAIMDTIAPPAPPAPPTVAPMSAMFAAPNQDTLNDAFAQFGFNQFGSPPNQSPPAVQAITQAIGIDPNTGLQFGVPQSPTPTPQEQDMQSLAYASVPNQTTLNDAFAQLGINNPNSLTPDFAMPTNPVNDPNSLTPTFGPVSITQAPDTPTLNEAPEGPVNAMPGLQTTDDPSVTGEPGFGVDAGDVGGLGLGVGNIGGFGFGPGSGEGEGGEGGDD